MIFPALSDTALLAVQGNAVKRVVGYWTRLFLRVAALNLCGPKFGEDLVRDTGFWLGVQTQLPAMFHGGCSRLPPQLYRSQRQNFCVEGLAFTNAAIPSQRRVVIVSWPALRRKRHARHNQRNKVRQAKPKLNRELQMETPAYNIRCSVFASARR